MITRAKTGLGVSLCVGVCLMLATAPSLAAVLPTDLKIEKVLDNTAEMGDILQSPLGELWLLEKAGTIRVFVAGTEQASLVLPVMTTCESGLLDLAFAPDYSRSGLAFVYYVDSTGNTRVDELHKSATSLQLGANILDLGTTPGGCRPGGGLDIGADGKLYVGVGDLETPANGQDDGTLPGKVLRAELDGGLPGDNGSGTLVWAKGFRNGTDLEVGATGTVYVTDLGLRPEGSEDEINAVHEGGNYGWDMVSGDSGGVYDDPLTSYLPNVGAESLTVLTGASLGDENQDTLVYACSNKGQIEQAVLTGADLDQLDSLDGFYDSLDDDDGTPDAGCPTQFDALTEGGEGWLYGSNFGANPGIWRIWHDDPGPREVSAPGSPLTLTLAKAGTDLEIGWEDIGPLDSGRPLRNGGQDEFAYRIWEGNLANVASYDHVRIVDTDGTSTGPARRTEQFTPRSGNRYYLLSAQNDNLEGAVGAASDGTPRPVPGTTDYCENRYGINTNQCAADWIDHSTGGVLKLRDANPYSSTYDQFLSISDFRGKVIRMDISADNCYYCNLQAPFAAQVEDDYHARDFVGITMMTLSYSTLQPIPESLCEIYTTGWADQHGVHGPIFCDVDLNGDGYGDVTWQYWHQAGCGGTPQNFYIDQGHTIYQFVCGGELSYSMIQSRIASEVNPETCE
jgi:hypothetical protein